MLQWKRYWTVAEFSNRFQKPEIKAEQAIDQPKHRLLLRKAAADGMVLLKNEGLLPLKKKLIGTFDYSTFRSSSCQAKSPIRTIKSIKIRSSKNKIEIEFKSQSFLQQQVRSMVGCLKYLGEKKWDLKTFDKVFKSKKRILCAPPAPPEGLFLTKVTY